MFASKNNVGASALDGLGMGVGFTLALFVMGSIREILGSGTWFAGTDFAITICPDFIQPMTLFVLPAGGFFVLGCVIALVNKISHRKPPEATGCAACPNKSSCISACADNSGEKGVIKANVEKPAEITAEKKGEDN